MLRTIYDGVLGAMTFGIYHHYVSMKQIELNNKKIETNQQQKMDKIKIQLKNNDCLYQEIYNSIQ
jgi:hypothetical protein